MQYLLAAAAVLVGAVVFAACTNGGADPVVGGEAVAHAEEAALSGDGVTVEAVGTIDGTPDVFTALIGVRVEADAVETAYDEGNEAAAAVRDALVDAGVDADDLQTAQLSLGAAPRRGPDDEPEGYVATTQLRVDIRDLEQAGAVLDDAVSAGGGHATLASLGFALDDDADLVVEAREAAFAEARAKAEQYAELADRSLGELSGLAEAAHPRGPVPRPMPGMAIQEDAARADAPPVEPGQEEVEVRIRATWALE